MSKKHIFLRVFSKITILVCVFGAFFVSPVFATLPAGYTELEYIESTGTQWIDTGVNAKCGISKYEVDCLITDSTGTWQVFTGTSTGTTSQLYIGINKDRVICYRDGQSMVDKATAYTIAYNDRHKFVLDSVNHKISIDSNVYDTEYATNTKQTPVYLFAGFNGTKNDWHIKGKIYSAKYYESSVLVRNFIPAKRNSDNVVGMYDTVTNTFFTNQGTGDFIAGPIAHCKTVSTDGVMCAACESGYKLNSNGVCVGDVIEIATTKMVDEEFAAAEAKLATTVQTIESVVSRTITQTGQIATLQETKQTRPDESCPANMKCLLVQDEDGTPHWYPIIEP